MGLLCAAPASAFVEDLLIILGFAGVVALAMHRLKLSLIPAYLLTGVVIGPHALGLVSQAGHVQEIGELAIVLLMFGVGMHLDWRLLAGRLRTFLTGGVLSVVLCALLLWPVAMLTGGAPAQTLVLAMALSLSSTAVVVRILQQRMETTRRRGQLSLAILVLQDLAVVVMLFMLPPLARWHGTTAPELQAGGESLTEFLRRGVVTTLVLAGLVVFGRVVLTRLLREAARLRTDEVMIVIATAFAIGSAALSASLGLSPELGAFLAGFLLSGTQFKHHLGGQIATLRNLFIAVFFTTFGMYIDAASIISNLPVVIGGTLLVMLAKVLAIGLACWIVGASLRMSLVVGVCLAQAGEFSIIVLGTASSADIGIIDERMLGLATSIVAISLALTPALFSLGDVIARKMHIHIDTPWIRSGSILDERQDEPDEGSVRAGHVVVAGYGVAGRAVTDRLARAGRRVHIVELNPRTVRTQRNLGWRVVYGDVSNIEVLRSVEIERAEALVLTMPDAESATQACRIAKQLNPDLYVIARTAYVGQSVDLYRAGADAVLSEELTVACAMEQEIDKALTALAEKRAAREQRDNAGATEPGA